jgi:excisionase family DNA binding protein
VVSVNSEDYVTVVEAATLLKVSQSTIWRWIGEGELPAYRLGQRRVWLRKSDLARLISPIGERLEVRRQETSDAEQKSREPLTAEERGRGIAAIEQARRLQESILANRGGRPFSSSWRLLEELREERTEDVG